MRFILLEIFCGLYARNCLTAKEGMMYKDCYRGYNDLRALFIERVEEYMNTESRERSSLSVNIFSFMEYLTKWCVDNGYQLERFEIAGEDVPDEERLDLTDLIIPPAKKEGK